MNDRRPTRRERLGGERASALAVARELTEEGKALDAQGSVEDLSDEALLERYAPLCRRVAMSLYESLALRPGAIGDMEADAHLGLLEARHRYDPASEVAFSTFAYYRIKGAILDGLRKAGTIRRRGALEAKMQRAVNMLGEARVTAAPTSSSYSTLLRDVDQAIARGGAAYLMIQEAMAREAEGARRTPSRQMLDAELRQGVAEAIEALPEVEKKTVIAVYVEDRSLSEVGDELGYSRSWMSRVHSRALEAIELHLRDMSLHE